MLSSANKSFFIPPIVSCYWIALLVPLTSPFGHLWALIELSYVILSNECTKSGKGAFLISLVLLFQAGTAKVDAASDEVHTMHKLLAEPLSGYQRPHLKMPCHILDEKERSIQIFISNNALIEYHAAFEQERKMINLWTLEEKKIFLDTFFLYNKNFQKIASFIEHKIVSYCIEFYYKMLVLLVGITKIYSYVRI